MSKLRNVKHDFVAPFYGEDSIAEHLKALQGAIHESLDDAELRVKRWQQDARYWRMEAERLAARLKYLERSNAILLPQISEFDLNERN